MAVIRVNKTKDYTIMSNTHFKEKDMSLKAKGLLSLMLSLPDTWDYSIAGIVSICKENESAIKSTLNELKAFGYLTIIKKMPNETDSGRIEYEYNIYEKPQIKLDLEKQGTVKQGVVIQPLEFQGVENQGQYNTNTLNTKESNTKKSNTKRFIPPTLEEVEAYCRERGNKVDAKKFYDYYTTGDWKDSKGKPVKNWKQRLITWESNTWDSKKGSNRTADMLEDSYDMMKEWSES